MSPDVRRRPSRPVGRARCLSPLLLLLLLLLLVAACGGTSTAHSASPSFSPTSPSPSAGPGVSDTAAAAQANLLAAYAATYADVESAVRAGKVDSAGLGRHAVDGALDQLRQGVEQYLNLGVVPIGVPELHAHVTSMALNISPAQAVVDSCPSAPRLVNRKTGEPVTFKALPANPVTVDLQTVQGSWVVSLFKVDRTRTCSG